MTDLECGATPDAGRRSAEPTDLADGYYQVAPGKLVNVVTWLEMRGRPATLPAAPLRLVPADQASRPTVRALFTEIGTPWLWNRAHDITGGIAGIFVARDDDDRPVGLVELSSSAPKQVEIVHFGLIPAMIGAGLGRRMMAATLDLAWRSAERVWLHTCSFDHPAALTFYRSCGFVPYATGFEIMDDPRRDGRLPKSAAPHVPLIGAS